jgi:hypothetical protein
LWSHTQQKIRSAIAAKETQKDVENELEKLLTERKALEDDKVSTDHPIPRLTVCFASHIKTTNMWNIFPNGFKRRKVNSWNLLMMNLQERLHFMFFSG